MSLGIRLGAAAVSVICVTAGTVVGVAQADIVATSRDAAAVTNVEAVGRSASASVTPSEMASAAATLPTTIQPSRTISVLPTEPASAAASTTPAATPAAAGKEPSKVEAVTSPTPVVVQPPLAAPAQTRTVSKMAPVRALRSGMGAIAWLDSGDARFGQSVTIVGQGFLPSDIISVTNRGAVLHNVNADNAGNFRATFPVDDTFRVGDNAVQVMGQQDVAQVVVHVEAPVLNVAASHDWDSDIVFTGGGFPPGDDITVQNTTTGKQVGVFTSDRDGLVEFSVTASPNVFRSGQNTITAASSTNTSARTTTKLTIAGAAVAAATGQWGQDTTVRVSGFGDAEQVTLRIGDVTIGSARTNSEGAAAVTFRPTPGMFKVGPNTLTAVSASFTAGIPGDLTIEAPEMGAAAGHWGESVTLQGHKFAPGDRIGFSTPNGPVPDVSVVVAPDGSFTADVPITHPLFAAAAATLVKPTGFAAGSVPASVSGVVTVKAPVVDVGSDSGVPQKVWPGHAVTVTGSKFLPGEATVTFQHRAGDDWEQFAEAVVDVSADGDLAASAVVPAFVAGQVRVHVTAGPDSRTVDGPEVPVAALVSRVDGDVVTITGTGFRPGSDATVRANRGNVPSGQVRDVVTGSQGGFTATFQVSEFTVSGTYMFDVPGVSSAIAWLEIAAPAPLPDPTTPPPTPTPDPDPTTPPPVPDPVPVPDPTTPQPAPVPVPDPVKPVPQPPKPQPPAPKPPRPGTSKPGPARPGQPAPQPVRPAEPAPRPQPLPTALPSNQAPVIGDDSTSARPGGQTRPGRNPFGPGVILDDRRVPVVPNRPGARPPSSVPAPGADPSGEVSGEPSMTPPADGSVDPSSDPSDVPGWEVTDVPDDGTVTLPADPGDTVPGSQDEPPAPEDDPSDAGGGQDGGLGGVVGVAAGALMAAGGGWMFWKRRRAGLAEAEPMDGPDSDVDDDGGDVAFGDWDDTAVLPAGAGDAPVMQASPSRAAPAEAVSPFDDAEDAPVPRRSPSMPSNIFDD